MQYVIWACFSFRGRISVGTYWGVIAVALVSIFLGTAILAKAGFAFVPIIMGKWMMLAALAKRWHDCGYSGAMCLLNFVPVIGLISLVVAGGMAGSPGLNRYGDEPDVGSQAKRLTDEVSEIKSAQSHGSNGQAEQDEEIAADSARLNYLGRNVKILFQTQRGMVAQIKNLAALAQVSGDVRLFNSLEDYRSYYNDRETWQQVTNSIHKWQFFASVQEWLEEVNDSLHEKEIPAASVLSNPSTRQRAGDLSVAERMIQCPAGNAFDPVVDLVCPCPSCWADRASHRLLGKGGIAGKS